MKRFTAFLLIFLLLTGCASRGVPSSQSSEGPDARPGSSAHRKKDADSDAEQPPDASDSSESSTAPGSLPQAPASPITPGQPFQLRFGQLLDETYNVSSLVKRLDGQIITMTGFMAMQSPLDGSFVYLTNLPLVVCPYCAPGTDTPIFTVPVYQASGKPIEFSMEAVTVVGKLEVKETYNEFGHMTPFHITATSIKKSNYDLLPAALKEYAVMANDGVTLKALEMIDALLNVTAYYIPIYEQDSVKLTPVEEIEALIAQIKAYNFGFTAGLIEILNRLHSLQSQVNNMVADGQLEETVIYAEDAMELWEDYLLWGGSITELE